MPKKKSKVEEYKALLAAGKNPPIPDMSGSDLPAEDVIPGDIPELPKELQNVPEYSGWTPSIDGPEVPVDTIKNPNSLPDITGLTNPPPEVTQPPIPDMGPGIEPPAGFNLRPNTAVKPTPSMDEIGQIAANEGAQNQAKLVPGQMSSLAAHFNYPETAHAIGEKVGGALDNEASKGLLNTLVGALTGVVRGASNGFNSMSEPINAGVKDIRQSIAPLANNPLIQLAGKVASVSDKGDAANAVTGLLFGQKAAELGNVPATSAINPNNPNAPVMLNDKLDVNSAAPSSIHHTSTGISGDKYKMQRASIDDMKSQQIQYAASMAFNPYAKNQYDSLQKQIDDQTSKLNNDMALDASQRKLDMSFGKDPQGGPMQSKAKDLGDAYNSATLYLHNAIKFAKQGDVDASEAALGMIPALTKNLTGVKAAGQEQSAMSGGTQTTGGGPNVAGAALSLIPGFGPALGQLFHTVNGVKVFNKQAFNAAVKSTQSFIDNIKNEYEANAEQAGATPEQRDQYLNSGTRNETVQLIADPITGKPLTDSDGNPVKDGSGKPILVAVDKNGHAVQPAFATTKAGMMMYNPENKQPVSPDAVVTFGREYNQEQETNDIRNKVASNSMLTPEEESTLVANIANQQFRNAKLAASTGAGAAKAGTAQSINEYTGLNLPTQGNMIVTAPEAKQKKLPPAPEKSGLPTPKNVKHF